MLQKMGHLSLTVSFEVMSRRKCQLRADRGRFEWSHDAAVQVIGARRRFFRSREAMAPRLPPRSGGCVWKREAPVSLRNTRGAKLFRFLVGPV